MEHNMPLERRQKILIPLILLALLYIVWQIYDMFIANDHANIPVKETSTTPLKSTPNIPSTPTSQIVAPQTKPQSATTISTAPPTLTADQQEYLQLVNEYQMLKLQRKVTEEQAAIAEAKEKIAELNKTTAKLTGVTLATDNNEFSTSNHQFKLVYLDEQGSNVSATISKNDHYYEIYKGSTINGLKVIAITHQGIVLNNNQKTYLLTFQGMRPLLQTASKKLAGKTKRNV